MSLSHVIPTGELETAHPLIGKLISAREVPKLKHFLETWKILTNSEILELVEGYKIPFNKNPVQQKIPVTPHTNLDQRHQVQVEIDNMLEKALICQISHSREEGLGKPPCNQLKVPESIHTIPELQNGRLALSERNIADGRFHVQTGYEGCIFFSIPLHQSSRKYVRFL